MPRPMTKQARGAWLPHPLEGLAVRWSGPALILFDWLFVVACLSWSGWLTQALVVLIGVPGGAWSLLQWHRRAQGWAAGSTRAILSLPGPSRLLSSGGLRTDCRPLHPVCLMMQS